MGWVTFTRDYDWHVPGTRSVVSYKQGSTLNVKSEVEGLAVEAGAARKAKSPKSGKGS